MARLAFVFVAVLAAFVAANEEEIVPEGRFLENVQGEENLKGIPKVIETNFPASLNNIALSYSQTALDTSHNLVDASTQLHARLSSYDTTQTWGVAIEPAAYYITSRYFAHYLVNNYNVFVYTVKCQ